MVIRPDGDAAETGSWSGWERAVIGADRPEAAGDPARTEPPAPESPEPRESLDDLRRWTDAARERVRYR